MNEKIREELLTLEDINYKKFHTKLCPGINNIIGIRIPVIKKLAKTLSKESNIINYINSNGEKYYEEIMLKGLLIGYIKTEINVKFSLLESYIPKIDNWAICDSVISNLKFIKNNKEETWDFIKKYIISNEEFETRFAVVVILNYFIEETYIDEIFNILDSIKLDKYYTKMSIAWTISICFIKFREKTFLYLKNNNLDSWTYNKSLQKIIESNRVSKNDKDIIRSMKEK